MKQKFPFHLLIIFLLLATGIGVSGYLYYTHQAEHFKIEAGNNLSSIADLKVGQIANWREERLGDAQTIYDNPLISSRIQQWLNSGSSETKQEILIWMKSLQQQYHYKSLILLDPKGKIHLAYPNREELIGPDAKRLTTEAISSGKVVFSDLYRSSAKNDIRLTIIVPLYVTKDHKSLPLSVLLLRIDPYLFLYPLIQSWPAPSRTAETVLFRREGNNVVFLNELRNKKNTALNLRFSISEPNLPSAMAMRGIWGVVEGIDYQGVPILATVKPVPNSPWYVIAKINKEEIYAPVREHLWMVTILMIILIAGAGTGIILIWRHQQASLFREKYETEIERAAERKQAEENLLREKRFADSTINSLPGVFYLFDEQMRLLRWNRNFETVSGFSSDELADKNAFDFIAAEDRNLVEERVREVLSSGSSTVEARFISKGGEKTPYLLTGTLLEADTQNYILGVGIDIAERKQTEERIRKLNRTLAVLSDINQAIVRTRDLQTLFEQACKIAIEKGNFALTWIGLLDNLTQRIQPVASAGRSESYLEKINISLNDKPRSFCPIDSALLKGEHVVCNVIGQDDELASCQKIALDLGFRSSVSFPLRVFGDIRGTVNFYAGEPHFFDEEECKLLDELTMDISFALEFAEKEGERKQAEVALRQAHERLQRFVDSNIVGVVVATADGNIIEANDYYLQMIGYTREELDLGKVDWRAITPPEWLPSDELAIQELRERGICTPYEKECVRRDGTRISVFLADAMLPGPEEQIAAFALDITERKKTEAALRASEAELHDAYFSEAAINMILSESLGEIPFDKFLQKALNMILSVPWIAFEAIGSIYLVEDEDNILVMKAHSGIPVPLAELCARVPLGKCLCGKAAQTREVQFVDHVDESHEICCREMRPHGHYVLPILYGGMTLGVLNIYLKEGHARNKKEEDFLCSVTDTLAGIIMRRKVEDEKEKLHTQFLQAQKMEAVGQLAGGVAHDFNNILTAMIGYGSILKMKTKEGDPLRMYADHILSLSDRAANLTQSLLAFSRKRMMNPNPTDINEIIRRIDHLLSRIIGEDIRLQTVLSEKALIVMADPGQIEQILMNLAANARDAMPKGGLLTIATKTINIDHEFIKEHGFGKEGRYAFISFDDTGIGMNKETREKIFEPFFTTKEVGRGTGLGLSMVYGIIKQHEGYINVYSEPGTGTTFRIYLPLIDVRAEEIKSEAIQPIETGTEAVLLAEDETEVRILMKKFLEDYGYKVIEAIDGDAAVDKFRMFKNEIELLLLDVIMPHKNGRAVYDEIKQIRPDVKVLFMSGYPADVIQKHEVIEKEFAYIEKPVSPAKLLRKIREILDQ